METIAQILVCATINPDMPARAAIVQAKQYYKGNVDGIVASAAYSVNHQ